MGTLLTTPVLVVDQVTGFLSNDFAIHDPDGIVVGRIDTGGSPVARFLAGSRQLSVSDDDGSVEVHVDDVASLGRDRVELTGPTGAPLATLRKEFTFGGLTLTVEGPAGSIRATGSFFERDFTISRPDREVARIQRTYAGIGAALLGHQRYVVALDPAATDDDRRITLGIAVAVDLIREKERRRRR